MGKLEAQVKAYDAAKRSHLESQAAYHGAKSKAADALKKYNEAVKKHCDYESLHTKLVKQINHGHLATNECGKDFACPEGCKPYDMPWRWHMLRGWLDKELWSRMC